MKRRAFVSSAAVAGSIGILPALGVPTYAQETWPTKPIKLVVPYPPGGLTDSLGRVMAERWKTSFGQPVVVENRAGQGSLVAASQIAKAAPDGYNLIVATSSTLGISQAVYPNPLMQVDELKGIGMLGSVTLFVVARASFPAHTFAEMVALLKKDPGKYVFATPGIGSPHHLLTEMIKQRAGIKALHVPFNGSAAALKELLADRIDLVIFDATVALPHAKQGTLKVLATTSANRSPLAPTVPSVSEIYPDVALQVWQGIAGPKNLPPAIAARINAEIRTTLSTPEMKAKLEGMGLEPNALSVDEFNAMILRDAPKWAELAKLAGAKVE